MSVLDFNVGERRDCGLGGVEFVSAYFWALVRVWLVLRGCLDGGALCGTKFWGSEGFVRKIEKCVELEV